MKQLLTIIILATFVGSCQSQDCESLPYTFKTYESALSQIKKSTFHIDESVNTSKSSWIKGASYLSCNGNTGYLILKTTKTEYLHQGVPKEVWMNFKNAESFGSYYTKHIKGRYQLKIN